MSALSNDDREAERRHLLAEAIAERFPVWPWWEARRRPSPAPGIPRPLIRTTESAAVTERRRRKLDNFMGNPDDQRWETAA